MNIYVLMLRFAILFGLVCHTVGLFSWLFNERPNQDHPSREVPKEMVAKANTPFEMQTADDKFLAESQFTKDLAPLDLCHHGVIAEITSTCSDLTEAELGKLAVQLLNCQSQAEGRQVFPCTQDMTIAECTGDMDPVTWNAYQIVSNRARAVCYATRQEHFRMKTQNTVNMLVHTAQGQLRALHKIQDGHEELSEATLSTLDKVQTTQEELSDGQERLLRNNQQVNSYIVGNIKDLTREKALIASGNRELAAMTEGLKAKLEETSDKILEQGTNQKHNHKEILQDLATIRDKAREVWEKIDISSKDIHHFHSETTEHYRHTLANLERVNATIQYLEDTIHNTKNELESKLNWIVGMVGGTGDRVALLSAVFLHAVYLLIGALSSAFLQTPRFSRLLLLALVPLNAWAQVHNKPSLGFLPMTMFITLTVAANWVLTWIWRLYARRQMEKSYPKALTAPPPSSSSSSASTSPSMQGSYRGKKRSSRGVLSPDIHKLVNILENMYNTGLLANTPRSMRKQRENEMSPVSETLAITHIESPGEPSEPSPSPDNNNSKRTGDLALVRRHLLEKLDTVPTSTPRKQDSPAPSVPCTPIKLTPEKDPPKAPANTPKAISTPRRASIRLDQGTPKAADVTPKRASTPRRESFAAPASIKKTLTPKGSRRASTPNTSVSRALCLATTKTGFPCKLQSLEGSAFCYRHQV